MPETKDKDKRKRTNTRRLPQKVAACYFTETKTKPDYKDVLVLKRFITDRGKIIHHSKSGVSSKNQRLLATAIKRARFMAFLPYSDKHAL
ncbi:MAG TPA: 30S ribosomal protein S18 [Candidatus Saccharimonadales bacterium]|nr:30S ribosomal protein S18 [Candidatus Saccharimonadales bacterium]